MALLIRQRTNLSRYWPNVKILCAFDLPRIKQISTEENYYKSATITCLILLLTIRLAQY